MRRLTLCLAVMVLFALSALGCSGSMSPMEPQQDNSARTVSYLPDEYCGDALTVNLIAGQKTDAGDVIVTNDGNYLYVEFVVEEPWVLVETHVAVSDSLSGIPQTKTGNPQIGKFPYTMNSYIDISQWPAGTPLYIAAHAVVHMLGENGEIYREETAWGEGPQFPGKSWAMYFMYEIQDCCVDLNLPKDLVNFKVNFGIQTYIDSTFWNIPSGYDIYDGVWDGWCVDKDNLIYVNTNYQAYVFNSYDPDTWPNDPRLNVPWDKINWIINNHDGYTKEEAQAAIWWFSNQFPYSGNVGNLVNAADANGAGFVPGPGEDFALIVYVPTNPDQAKVQVTIIEVPTKC